MQKSEYDKLSRARELSLDVPKPLFRQLEQREGGRPAFFGTLLIENGKAIHNETLSAVKERWLVPKSLLQ
jgi:hypothetical protein